MNRSVFGAYVALQVHKFAGEGRGAPGTHDMCRFVEEAEAVAEEADEAMKAIDTTVGKGVVGSAAASVPGVPERKARQFLEVTLHIRADDEDGYGIAKAAIPVDAIRWEGNPRTPITIEDVYQVDTAVTESAETTGRVETDLDC